jgi:NitT/TauT family transport system substrate-binding protein
MKKIFLLLILSALIGCNQTPTEATNMKILTPFGAPSIALLNKINDSDHEITCVSGTDLLLANLVNQTPDYQMIIAPINVGLALIHNQQTKYRLLSVITWGNLYLVGYDETDLQSAKTVALFGKDAVPEKILNYSISEHQITMKQQYYGSMMDTQAQLLTGQASVALLAEPLVSATLKQNSELKILMDIQQHYQSKSGFENYPQAALFVLDSFYQSHKSDVNQFIDDLIQYNQEITHNQSLLETDLSNTDLTALGLPPIPVIKDAYHRMNIHVSYALDRRDDIQAFMDLFNITLSDDMFAQ